MQTAAMFHHYAWLIPVGFLIGSYGTLIGAGGGFVLMPFLLLYYPNEGPTVLTSISLAVVFFNALSGSLAYSRMGRVDYKSGMLFSAASIPGAILGAFTSAYIPRRIFDLIFGVLMIGTCAFLMYRPERKKEGPAETSSYHFMRHIVEKDGTRHVFSYNAVLGVVWSLFVGFVSSLLGIGGGIIHVPVLAHLLNFPVHIATATSHFTLAFMSLTGTLVHIATGEFANGAERTVFLAVGVFAGAQLGARLSSRIHGIWIIRSLAIALGLVGLRLLLTL